MKNICIKTLQTLIMPVLLGIYQWSTHNKSKVEIVAKNNRDGRKNTKSVEKLAYHDYITFAFRPDSSVWLGSLPV